MKKCKQGYYYCYTEKKCKKIPMGYHIGARGYLAKDNDNEGEETKKNGNGNGNGSNGNGGESVSEEGLRDWFGKSKSKDGKKGWVNVVTGGTCASDEPGEGTPKCVSSAKRASMTKAERLSAQRRKKKADPGQQQKSGAAKPTYVSTDSKKKMKEEVQVTEAKDKKGKGSGSKDACYHKVKSRYSVWPSAYASGALVKCRKVGAANWGNKSEEVETIGLGEGKIADRLRQMNKDAKKRWDTEGEKAKKDAYKALDKVKSNQARMERGMTEGTQFSNWRDDFKATEYEFTDIIKPEPIKGGVIEEGSFSIDPKAHRQAQREKKIRDRTKTGDEGSSIAKTKTKGPDLMGEEVVDEMISTSGVRRYDTPEAQKSIRQKKEKEQKRKRRLAPERTPEGDRVIRGRDARGSYKMVKRVKFYEDKEEVIDEKIDVRKQSSKRKSLGRGSSINPDAKKTGYESPSEFRKTEKKLAPYMGEDFEKEVPSGDIKKLTKKAVKRVDQNVSGHVDKKDKSMGEYGEFVPSPDGKSKIVTNVKRESFSNWRNEIEEGVDVFDPTGDRGDSNTKRTDRINDRRDNVAPRRTKSGLPLPPKKDDNKLRPGENYVQFAKRKKMGEEVQTEGASWTKKSGKDPEGGLNEKGRKSYEKENPGSDLKRPSKEVGNPRRKSFCARMKGMKKKLTSSKTANDPDSRINKSLRAWNC